MKFVFACTTQAPWPAFLERESVPDRLMSYAQLRNFETLKEFLECPRDGKLFQDGKIMKLAQKDGSKE